MSSASKTPQSQSSKIGKPKSKKPEPAQPVANGTPSVDSPPGTPSSVTSNTPIYIPGNISSNMGDDFKSTIQPRSGFSRQSMTSSTTGGNRSLRVVTETTRHDSSSMSPGLSHNAASAIRDSREKERKDLQDLNDRLASYIEKVRFLEAQNRKLAGDLDALRSRWGKDTSSIKLMFEGELDEARKVIDETSKARGDIEKQIAKLQADLTNYRKKYEEAVRGRDVDKDKIDQLLAQLSNGEAEVNLLRRRIEVLEEDVSRFKKENLRLNADLQRARTDLDQETLNRIDYQNQVQTLLEEIDFIRRVHDQEIKELQALAARDTTAENREYFKNELSGAIRDIRSEYDNMSANNRNDMESWYKLKVQEVQTSSARTNMEQGYQKEETKRLRVQLGDLRGKLGDLESRNSLLEKQVQELSYQLEDDQRGYEAQLNDRDAQIRKMREECQALMVELQMLLDTKQTLDAEIAIYRKMLEGEESRGGGLRQLVEQAVKTHSLTQNEDTETVRLVKGETATRTSFQRSAKGNVSVSEVSADGKYIVLENTHRSKEENLGEWKLKRKVDNKKEIVFTIPKDFILKPSKTLKITAKDQGGKHNPPEELIMEHDTNWGLGNNVQTLLYNRDGEERATHVQRASSQTTTA
jgi:intermediate filament protein if